MVEVPRIPVNNHQVGRVSLSLTGIRGTCRGVVATGGDRGLRGLRDPILVLRDPLSYPPALLSFRSQSLSSVATEMNMGVCGRQATRGTMPNKRVRDPKKSRKPLMITSRPQ